MKRITVFLGIILFTGKINAQIDVPQVQKSFYGVVEATWCGYCGQYGIPTTNAIVDQVGEKAIVYTLHKSSSSQLYSETAENIANAIGPSGTPFWTLNAMAIGGYNANLQNTLIDSINANYNASAAAVNAGFSWYVDNDTIYVETLTKFFNATSGDYNVAVYLSEDNIEAYQSNYDPEIGSGNIYHNHILRTSLSLNAFGVEAASGIINGGETFTNFHKIKIDPTWDLSQIHFSAVVWKANGGTYEFKNANDNGQGTFLTAIDTKDKDNIELNVYPNPASETLIVRTTDLKEKATIQLYAIDGRIVYQNKWGKKGRLDIKINVANLSSGEYMLSIISGNTKMTKQVLVK